MNKLEAEEKQEEIQKQLISKMDTSKFTIHKMNIADAAKSLNTDLKKGLTSAEAEKRLEKYGPNELDAEEDKSLWESIVEQFEDILVRILLASATISFVIAITGDGDEGLTAYVEPFVILLILVLNAIVAIWQDRNADSALEALKDLQAAECIVLRDGSWSTIDAKTLVPGDIVQVKQGQCVPADLRCAEIQSIALQIEQAALTGESVSVQKTTSTLGDSATMLQDQKNMLFSSTIVSSGTAVGIVAYTGMKTAIGNVHSEVMAAEKDVSKTPLEEKVDNFGELLAKVIFVICFLVWAMNYNKFFDAIHGTAFKGCIYYFKIAVALAVAAIPEGLPAVITTCLALGTRKMSANNCIVRRLPSVETLGCTSVICSDKTGTLTKNEMCAVKFGLVADIEGQFNEFSVEEKSYSPDGKILDGMTDGRFSEAKTLKHMAMVCSSNNRASIYYHEDKESPAKSQFKLLGEPTEAALKVLAEKIGRYDINGPTQTSNAKKNPTSYGNYLMKGINEVATLDFSSERKAMSKIVTGYNGNNSNTVLLKGAPERVLEKCTKIMKENGEESNLSASQR